MKGLQREGMLLLCREAVASGRRWSATARPAAWIKRWKSDKEGKTMQRDGERGRRIRRRRDGAEWGVVWRSRRKRGGKVNAPQGNATRRAKQYTESTTSECILPHFTTTSSLVLPTIRDYVFFWHTLFSEFPLPLFS